MRATSRCRSFPTPSSSSASTSSRPPHLRPLSLLWTAYALLTGHPRAANFLVGHDLDRIEIRCDRPLPLQVDGEDLGDVERAVFEAERERCRYSSDARFDIILVLQHYSNLE